MRPFKFLKRMAIGVCMLLPVIVAAQKAERLIIITTDGLRWQELFTGMDSAIANSKKFNQGDSAAVFEKYWSNDPAQRRKLLMPFFWNTIAKQGQVYGNRMLNNKVDVANIYRFSYPGYNEIFTGNPDTAINSNDYPPNPYVTVLEYLNKQTAFKGKVAAFSAWNAFDRILNEKRSNMPVYAAFDTVAGNITERQQLINSMLQNSFRPFNNAECLDVYTHYGAFEYLKVNKPKVLYISYGETDEWAHAGEYWNYLRAATQLDTWLGEIWNYVQATPEYRNKTALLITVDHGRGRKTQWTSHGQNVEGANEIWFAAMGPAIPAKGEVKSNVQLYQKQMAKTIAEILGVDYKPEHPVANSLIDVLK